MGMLGKRRDENERRDTLENYTLKFLTRELGRIAYAALSHSALSRQSVETLADATPVANASFQSSEKGANHFWDVDIALMRYVLRYADPCRPAE
jgi:hypothetical protein